LSEILGTKPINTMGTPNPRAYDKSVKILLEPSLNVMVKIAVVANNGIAQGAATNIKINPNIKPVKNPLFCPSKFRFNPLRRLIPHESIMSSTRSIVAVR